MIVVYCDCMSKKGINLSFNNKTSGIIFTCLGCGSKLNKLPKDIEDRIKK